MKKIFFIFLTCFLGFSFADSVELDLTKSLKEKGIDKKLSDMDGLGTDGYAKLEYAKIVTKNNNIEIEVKINVKHKDCWKLTKFLGCFGTSYRFNIFANAKLKNEKDGSCRIDIYNVETSDDFLKIIDKLADKIGNIFGKDWSLKDLEKVRGCT